MGYKIFRIKLTLLYTTVTLSTFMVLLAIIGVSPFIPWYGSANCQNYTLKDYKDDTLIAAVTECSYLSIGLFTTEECVGGNCKVKSNADIDFDALTKQYTDLRTQDFNLTAGADATVWNKANNTADKTVGSLSINSDFTDMHDVEKAGVVSFPFLLLGFLILVLAGLFCFHHLVSESYHVIIGMSLFGSISLFLLICVACYGGIMANNDGIESMCDAEMVNSYDACLNNTELRLQVEANLTTCEYDETSDLCGFGPGYWLTVLALVNCFISIGVSFLTNPDALEEE